jgi:lipopolysaccharide/colanic/teichoic acid biosynthesis glycosyltransferase
MILMARSTVHPYYFSPTKRVFDIVLSVTLLVILLPVVTLISSAIAITAGWPIIFKQKRFGQHKQPFTIYKFRVMYNGADKHQWRHRTHNQAPEPMYKNWNDPRFTGIGRWLCKMGLDELPQLINILKGEMSFVGPRPLPIEEAQQLPVSWEGRYKVKPGVFSEWSLSPQRHQSLSIWHQLDKNGLQSGGLTYELRTIVQTFLVLLHRHRYFPPLWPKKLWLVIVLGLLLSLLALFKLNQQLRLYVAEYLPLPTQVITSIWVPRRYVSLNSDQKQTIADWYTKKNIDLTEKPSQLFADIGRSVYQDLDPLRGTPDNNYPHVFGMWSRTQDQTTQVWCEQFAQTYALLANEAGIPTRIIHLLNRTDEYNTAYHHTVAESYISDYRQWVMVDLTFGQVEYKQHSDVYNVVELTQHLSADIQPSDNENNDPTILSLDPNTIPELIAQHRHYFNSETRLMYESKTGNPFYSDLIESTSL